MMWRRLRVPAGCTLRELHDVLQVAMGRERIHLFQVRLRANPLWLLGAVGLVVRCDLGGAAAARGARFTYEYDLNIPWRHEVRVEENRPAAEPGTAHPVVTGGNGACPPEDCGGPVGYGRPGRGGVAVCAGGSGHHGRDPAGAHAGAPPRTARRPGDPLVAGRGRRTQPAPASAPGGSRSRAGRSTPACARASILNSCTSSMDRGRELLGAGRPGQEVSPCGPCGVGRSATISLQRRGRPHRAVSRAWRSGHPGQRRPPPAPGRG